MFLLSLAAGLVMTAGHLWMAWEAWEQEGLLWGLLVLLIPLAGLFFWWRTDFDSRIRKAGILYLVGYGLNLVLAVVG